MSIYSQILMDFKGMKSSTMKCSQLIHCLKILSKDSLFLIRNVRNTWETFWEKLIDIWKRMFARTQNLDLRIEELSKSHYILQPRLPLLTKWLFKNSIPIPSSRLLLWERVELRINTYSTLSTVGSSNGIHSRNILNSYWER